MRLLFLTGAGISANAGLPTYRGVDGVYTNSEFKIEDFLTFENYKRNTSAVSSYIKELIEKFSGVEPSSWHTYIADLEKDHDVLVVTQNVDGLHQKAGSTNVIELHGNANRMIIREGYELPDIVFFDDCLDANNFVNADKFIRKGVDFSIVVGTTMGFPYLQDLALSGTVNVLVDPDKNHHFKDSVHVHYTDIHELKISKDKNLRF